MGLRQSTLRDNEHILTFCDADVHEWRGDIANDIHLRSLLTPERLDGDLRAVIDQLLEKDAAEWVAMIFSAFSLMQIRKLVAILNKDFHQFVICVTDAVNERLRQNKMLGTSGSGHVDERHFAFMPHYFAHNDVGVELCNSWSHMYASGANIENTADRLQRCFDALHEQTSTFLFDTHVHMMKNHMTEADWRQTRFYQAFVLLDLRWRFYHGSYETLVRLQYMLAYNQRFTLRWAQEAVLEMMMPHREDFKVYAMSVLAKEISDGALHFLCNVPQNEDFKFEMKHLQAVYAVFYHISCSESLAKCERLISQWYLPQVIVYDEMPSEEVCARRRAALKALKRPAATKTTIVPKAIDKKVEVVAESQELAPKLQFFEKFNHHEDLHPVYFSKSDKYIEITSDLWTFIDFENGMSPYHRLSSVALRSLSKAVILQHIYFGTMDQDKFKRFSELEQIAVAERVCRKRYAENIRLAADVDLPARLHTTLLQANRSFWNADQMNKPVFGTRCMYLISRVAGRQPETLCKALSENIEGALRISLQQESLVFDSKLMDNLMGTYITREIVPITGETRMMIDTLQKFHPETARQACLEKFHKKYAGRINSYCDVLAFTARLLPLRDMMPLIKRASSYRQITREESVVYTTFVSVIEKFANAYEYRIQSLTSKYLLNAIKRLGGDKRIFQDKDVVGFIGKLQQEALTISAELQIFLRDWLYPALVTVFNYDAESL